MATHILIRTHTDPDRTWSEGDVIAVSIGHDIDSPPFSNHELNVNVLVVLDNDVSRDTIIKWTEQNVVIDNDLDDPTIVLNSRKYRVNLVNLIQSGRIKRGRTSLVNATEEQIRDRVTKTRSEGHNPSIVVLKALDIARNR